MLGNNTPEITTREDYADLTFFLRLNGEATPMHMLSASSICRNIWCDNYYRDEKGIERQVSDTVGIYCVQDF